MSRARSSGLPCGCRPMKRKHFMMSRSTRGVSRMSGRHGCLAFTAPTFMVLALQCGNQSLVRGIVHRVERLTTTCLPIILGGGDDLVPLDPFGGIVILTVLEIH